MGAPKGNQYAVGNKGGRPACWKTPDELQKLCEEFFESCMDISGKQIKPFTITGLALSLGVDRQTILNYEKKDEFIGTIKKAKLRCENYAENLLFANSNAAGAIFALKNFGWRDQTEKKITGELTINNVSPEIEGMLENQ